ncbi:hypothetical protein PRUB_a3343 [Pseudoalteromonas rubra]|uniref:Uncharacterized protein n=1 Tax=Pseudoalteromonas rubra TaxID=43658 RepID=A0A8T0C2F9_9GAMM|nr:hypothetical protein PRUB_a3343 [Pseudoalteromonas rubra]
MAEFFFAKYFLPVRRMLNAWGSDSVDGVSTAVLFQLVAVVW